MIVSILIVIRIMIGSAMFAATVITAMSAVGGIIKTLIILAVQISVPIGSVVVITIIEAILPPPAIPAPGFPSVKLFSAINAVFIHVVHNRILLCVIF